VLLEEMSSHQCLMLFNIENTVTVLQICLTPWRLGGFGDFRKKKQQFSVALPTP